MSTTQGRLNIMQARELVEMAGLVAAHGPLMIECERPVSLAALEEYWTASKCRLDRWGRAMKKYQADSAGWDQSRSSESPSGLLEEIFSGEVLTRVWTAVMSAHDRRQGHEDAEIVTRSVLMSQMEARNRAVKMLLDSPAVDPCEAVRLNKLRRMSERWSDMLLGYLEGVADVSQFAVEPDRAHEFAFDVRYQSPLAGGSTVWALLRLSLREAFRLNLVALSPNADLNTRIGSSVLACFPADLFDSTGLLRSLWLSRLSHAATDAQGMIEELFTADLAVEESADPLADGPNRPTTRFNRSTET